MNWVVFQIASGRAFFAAVALLVAAVLLRSNGSPRRRRVSTWSFLVGLIALSVSAAPLPYWAYCERRSKSAARGGVARPVEKCSAQLCSGVGQENRGGAAISPYRERGTRSVCSDGDVD